MKVRVVKKEHLTERVCKLTLSRRWWQKLPRYESGAHIGLLLPNGLYRQYSLCSPSHQQLYEIAVQREPQGRGGSCYIHDELNVGDTLEIKGPCNLFSAVNTARPSAFFAAGIGITPILPMAEELALAGGCVSLYFSLASPVDNPFKERLNSTILKKNTRYYYSRQAGGERINFNDVLATLDTHTQLYVCGPSSYISEMIDTARGLGWSETNIHFEHFTPAEDSNTDKAEFVVKLYKSGAELKVASNQSLAEALLAKGVDVPISCNEGLCGSCITGVVDGEIDHRDSVLSESEKRSMKKIALCCSRAKTDSLTLDL